MRKVKLEDGREVEVKSLLRPDVRQLKADNLHPETIMKHADPAAAADEAMDRVIELSVGKEMAEEIFKGPMIDNIKVYQAVLAETYGAKEEEKNL